MGSVSTINVNSLMLQEPDDMPNIADIKRRATKLGKEGEVSVTRIASTPRVEPRPAGWILGEMTATDRDNQPITTAPVAPRRWGGG
jgi:hypothetical protein